VGGGLAAIADAATMTAVAADSLSSQIASAAKVELKECAKYLFFDDAGTVLCANFKVRASAGYSYARAPASPRNTRGIVDARSPRCCVSCFAASCSAQLPYSPSSRPTPPRLQVREAELKPIAALLAERDDAIRSGIHLDGVRHEVRSCCSLL
jgi:hypothetical protein